MAKKCSKYFCNFHGKRNREENRIVGDGVGRHSKVQTIWKDWVFKATLKIYKKIVYICNDSDRNT